MNQRFLEKCLLFVLLVPGLAFTYQPLKVMGTQPNSDVFIILAQENTPQNNSSARLEALKQKVKSLEKLINRLNQVGNLNNQIQQLPTEKNSNQTPSIIDPSSKNNLTLPGGKNMLVPLGFSIIVGGTVFFALRRKLILIKKTQKDLLQKGNTGDEKKRDKSEEKYQAKPSNIPESLHSSQHYSKTRYYRNISDTRESNSRAYNYSTKITNPVSFKTEYKKFSTSSHTKPEDNKPNSDYIQSEQDLVAIYNNHYQHLLDEIFIVKETKQSIVDKRMGYDSPIIFTGSDSGNYWVTTVPRLPDPYFCLLPKKNLVINDHNYTAIKYVFDCINYEQRNSIQFTLKEPAIVYWDNVTQSFCLHESGELYFKH